MGAPFFSNEKTWKCDTTQDSNQFDSAYLKLRKEKVSRKSKIPIKTFELINMKNTDKYPFSKQANSSRTVSNDFKSIETRASPLITQESDFNEDLDEFNELCIEKDKNKINLINIKNNDIHLINNKNKANLEPPGQYSYKKQLCITEPDNFIDPFYPTTGSNGIHNRNSSNQIINNNNNFNFNITPNKTTIPYVRYNLTPRNLNYPQPYGGVINNNIIYSNTPINKISNSNNFGNVMMFNTHKNSFISYQSGISSSNKVKEQGFYENEESTEIGDFSHEE